MGGRSSFLKGINQYTDLTLQQVIASYTGATVSNKTTKSVRFLSVRSSPYKNSTTVPHSLDWRTACNVYGTCGVISPVKNQGACGSCTTFAVNAALEAHTRLYGNFIHMDFSEQELLDCPPSGPGILRCNGNSIEDILDYVKTRGVPREADYPYQSGTTRREGPCRRSGIYRVASCPDYFNVPYNDEVTMKNWLAKYGPMTALIQVNNGFQSYRRGVLDMSCDNTRYDHAVAVVGYGRENGKDYWLVKNSWGTSWGEQGYVKMPRNANSFCKISSHVILPRLAPGYFNNPLKVTG